MIKALFFVVFGLVLGWTFHYLYTDSKQETIVYQLDEKECEDTHEVIEKVVVKNVVEYVPQVKVVYKTKKVAKEDENSSQDLFFIALEKKEFDNAMEHYEEADEEKHPLYRSALYAYFEKMQLKSPLETIEQMQTFIELEPENKLFVFQLAKLFEKREAYHLALNLLVELSYVIAFNEKKAVSTKIKSISLSYIEKLNKVENFNVLIDFLITRIQVGVLDEFYSYELAKAYLALKKYYASIEILQELKETQLYKERAVELLDYVQLKLEELKEYPIQIPLIRHGLHFLVKAKVENIEVLLMLDTGATTTSVDVNKVQSLEIIEENALFHTAAGKLYENIHEAKEFTIGTTTLNNFRVSGSHYTSPYHDGLLGMNFLGNFKFKIDQQEAILYLGDKSR